MFLQTGLIHAEAKQKEFQMECVAQRQSKQAYDHIVDKYKKENNDQSVNESTGT